MPDKVHGGFYGAADFRGVPDPMEDKGIILNARILWSFSAAFNHTGNNQYKDMAQRAWEYLTAHFEDKSCGGYYWKTDYSGRATETRKQTYAQAFVIYAFAEYYKAAKQKEVLDRALSLFGLLEQHARDKHQGGYWEALSREWKEIPDVRLSDKDLNEKKSLNTHLHVLEAYTALYQVAPSRHLGQSLRDLIELFPKYLINPNGHLNLFFDGQWQLKSHTISYGHDIEASWLLMEAAEALDDPSLKQGIGTLSLHMAQTFLNEAMAPEGGVLNETNTITGHTDTDRHWWVQIEAMVGLVRAYQQSGSEPYLETAVAIWTYIKTCFLDHQNGEWHWLIGANGVADTSQVKAGFWKCPYHNTRGCMEITTCLQDILQTKPISIPNTNVHESNSRTFELLETTNKLIISE